MEEYHVCFVCFMFVSCAFMKEKRMCHFIRFNLNHKCVSLSMLVFFVLHENSWEYDYYWCFGLRKNEELWIFKGGNFLQFGGFVGWFLEGQRKELNIMKFVWCILKLIEDVL